MLNQRLILKNTLFLYSRTLLNLLIGLYSTRIVLQVLGLENYGIFCLVSGAVTLFTVLNSSMFSATQKFITCAQSDSSEEGRTNIFSSCVWLHALIALVFFAVVELVGRCYLLPHLDIPEARRSAADFCFHCMIFVTMLRIVQVPLDVEIVAHEDISFYAYMGIADVLAKLGILLILKYMPGDKLRIYSLMFIVISCIILIINHFYCRRYRECKILFRIDWTLLKKMGSFFGWRILGGTSQMLETQGNNIVINLFHGVILNATLGVANQVGTLFYSLAQNFQTAFAPQIMKSYAAGKYDELWKLVHNSARISITLLFFAGGPLLLNADILLDAWLVKVPQNAELFVRGFVIYWILESISAPLWMTILATGRIMWYQIILSAITLSFVFVFWFSQYAWGVAALLIFLKIAMSVSIIIFRLILLKKMLDFDAKRFIFRTCAPMFLTAAVAIAAGLFCRYLLRMVHPFVSFMYTSAVYELLFIWILWSIALGKAERDEIVLLLKRKFMKNASVR